MNRAEHMAWAKTRALEYVDRGDCVGALASLSSDIRKHPETDNEAMTFLCALIGPRHVDDPHGMRAFIEGFA